MTGYEKSCRSPWQAVLVASVTVMLGSGCASVVSVAGAHYQNISVQTSEPGQGEVIGASCEIAGKNGKWYVTTPGTVMVPKSNEDLQVICRKADLDKGSAKVVSSFHLAMYGNAAIGGILGAAVDHVDGAAYEYPDSIPVVMGAARVIQLPDRFSATKPADPSTDAEGPVQVPPKGQDFQGSYTLLNSGVVVADSPAVKLKRPREISVTNAAAVAGYKKKRGDVCDAYTGRGEYCWWSPPGNYNVCPVQLSLSSCKSAYGKGCQLGHGKVVPSC